MFDLKKVSFTDHRNSSRFWNSSFNNALTFYQILLSYKYTRTISTLKPQPNILEQKKLAEASCNNTVTNIANQNVHEHLYPSGG